MIDSLRIALLLDPFSVTLDGPLNLRVKGGDHARKLATELLNQGHSVRGFGAPPGLIPRSSEGGVEGEESRRWWSKLRGFRPDVLLAYDALSPSAWRGARMARKLGSTLVLVEWGLPPDGRLFERALVRLGEFLWGSYVRRTTGAVVALDEVSRANAEREGFSSESIRIIRHGVDVNVFRPGLTSTLVAQHRIRGRILLYVGKLKPKRGLEILITAFARTVGQRSDWNLVLAGQGPLKPALRAHATRLGIGDRLHWLPRPRKEELPGLMGASTLLAIPALDDTVIGHQMGRAMACGLPILASDLPRLASFITSGENGLLVAAGDPQAWIDAIRQAASSPVARKRWAQAGRALAEKALAWPIVTREFQETFRVARERVQAKLGGKNGEQAPVSEDPTPPSPGAVPS